VLLRLWRHRDLVVSLSRRQYQLRYRQSFIGFAWAFLTPLATVGAAALVFGRVAGISTGKTSFAVSTMAAVVPWSFFASSVGFGVTSIVSVQGMIARLPFPRVALPLSMIGTAVLDLAIASVIFLAVAFVTGTGVPLTALWFPVLVIIELMLVTGIVLLGSAINVFARDVRLAVPLILQMWLLVTPVMYPLNAAPRAVRSWFLFNPLSGLVENFRRVLAEGRGINVDFLIPSLIGAVALVVLGTWYFTATEPRFADVV
jgi:homopolymeric O-antigen transport system permease protein